MSQSLTTFRDSGTSEAAIIACVSTILAFQGLLSHIKEICLSQEFESLSHLAQRLSNIDIRIQDPQRNLFPKKVNIVDDSSYYVNEVEIGLAKWVKNKKPISCLFAKKEAEKYGFDVTKADKIFDLLLQEGQIKLSPNHTIPSATILNSRKYR